MRCALFVIAFLAVALAADKDAAAAMDVPQELLQTESKSKFVSPFVNPYMLNPLVYFGAGMALPFLLGGGGGMAMGMDQMGMGQPPMMGMGQPPMVGMGQTQATGGPPSPQVLGGDGTPMPGSPVAGGGGHQMLLGTETKTEAGAGYLPMGMGYSGMGFGGMGMGHSYLGFGGTGMGYGHPYGMGFGGMEYGGPPYGLRYGGRKYGGGMRHGGGIRYGGIGRSRMMGYYGGGIGRGGMGYGSGIGYGGMARGGGMPYGSGIAYTRGLGYGSGMGYGRLGYGGGFGYGVPFGAYGP